MAEGKIQYSIPHDDPQAVCDRIKGYQLGDNVSCSVQGNLADISVKLPTPTLGYAKNPQWIKFVNNQADLYWIHKDKDQVLSYVYYSTRNTPTKELNEKCGKWDLLKKDIVSLRSQDGLPDVMYHMSQADEQALQTFCVDRGLGEISQDTSIWGSGVATLLQWRADLDNAEIEEQNSRLQGQADYASGLGLTDGQLSVSKPVELDIDLDLDGDPLVDLSDAMGGMYGENVKREVRRGRVTVDVGNGNEEFVVTQKTINIEGGEWVGDKEQALYVFSKIEVTYINGVLIPSETHFYPDVKSATERDAVLTNNGNKVTDLALFGKVKKDSKGKPVLEDGKPVRELDNNLVIGVEIDGYEFNWNGSLWDWKSGNMSDGETEKSGDDPDDIINDLKEGEHVETDLCGEYYSVKREVFLDMLIGIEGYADAKAEGDRVWSQKESEASTVELANLKRLRSSWSDVQSGDPKVVISKQETYNTAVFSKPPSDQAKIDKILAAYKKLTPAPKATEGNEAQGHEAAPTPQAGAQSSSGETMNLSQSQQVSLDAGGTQSAGSVGEMKDLTNDGTTIQQKEAYIKSNFSKRPGLQDTYETAISSIGREFPKKDGSTYVVTKEDVILGLYNSLKNAELQGQ